MTLNDKYSNMNIITADFNWISLLVIVIALVIGMMKSKTKKTMERPVFFPPEYEPKEETEEWYTVPEFSDGREDFRKDTDTARESEVIVEPSQSAIEYQPFEDTPVFHDVEEKEEEPVRIDLRQAIISSEILRRPDF